jgi:hypothetical protein
VYGQRIFLCNFNDGSVIRHISFTGFLCGDIGGVSLC